MTDKAAKAKRKRANRSRPDIRSGPEKPAFQLDALWLAALLVGAIFVAYSPVIDGLLLWDDDAHVTEAALRISPDFATVRNNLAILQARRPQAEPKK